LFPDAESDYTLGMRFGVAFSGLFCLVSCLLIGAGVSAADKSPRETYEQLNALAVDPASVYEIEGANRIELRRGDVQLSFEQGKLAFLQAFNGRLTGAVFSGRGHAFAAPRDVVEKQQMARFLGAPVLDQDFLTACLRFTDATADDLLRQLRANGLSPHLDSSFVASWNPPLTTLNPSQSLRILFETLSQNPKPFFRASFDGVTTGPFDVIFDQARDESVMFGQPKKSAAGAAIYNVWASYKTPGSAAPVAAFHALGYSIETSILANTSLEARTEVRFRAETDGERMLMFQLSRMLNVDDVTNERGEPLTYFQNEGMNLHERNTRGNDYLYVVLPAALPRETEFTLRFRYRGNVIQDAGNGVLYVGAREVWYPHFGDAADFADYDLTMRWPRRLRLVATGSKLDEHDDGDFRVGRWRTEKPVSVAGFNLGDYAFASLSSGTRSIDIYANHSLEQALNRRLGAADLDIPQIPSSFGGEGQVATQMMPIIPMAPSPADALKDLGREIDSSIRFYEVLSGPFPFQKLGVSQIPGTFGQGWPGLLYLSTFSFLPPTAQRRAGLSQSGQEHFTELVPFHEVAHQWWGNVVAWSHYRDQWIDEAIANYLALLFADSQKNANHSLRVWLGRYRQRLVEKLPGTEEPATEIGALELGSRLTSSKSPEGFEEVIYPKGSWVIHMLREMLRQPGGKNPDARFIALLHTLASKYAYRALSTADLQREVEVAMTPNMDLEDSHSMDWFFEEWVRGTGIPRYHVEFAVHRNEKGYLIRGKLWQRGVPRSFIAPVPLYASASAGHSVLLGVVTAEGPETPFHFTAEAPPHKVIIDPRMTLLCVTE
jgi:peptidase M1-like protein